MSAKCLQECLWCTINIRTLHFSFNTTTTPSRRCFWTREASAWVSATKRSYPGMGLPCSIRVPTELLLSPLSPPIHTFSVTFSGYLFTRLGRLGLLNIYCVCWVSGTICFLLPIKNSTSLTVIVVAFLMWLYLGFVRTAFMFFKSVKSYTSATFHSL